MTSIPSLENVTFLMFEFFQHHAEFPSFKEIRVSCLNTGPKPHIVTFEDTNLLVKLAFEIERLLLKASACI